MSLVIVYECADCGNELPVTPVIRGERLLFTITPCSHCVARKALLAREQEWVKKDLQRKAGMEPEDISLLYPTVADYTTEWGTFILPEGLKDRTKWHVDYTLFGIKRKPIVRAPLPISDNHEFFTWLHNEEVKAGKPERDDI